MTRASCGPRVKLDQTSYRIWSEVFSALRESIIFTENNDLKPLSRPYEVGEESGGWAKHVV